MNDWISVKHRLPKAENGERVIVFSPCYKKDSEMRCRIVDRQFVKILTDATHWMPLPDPPESTD